MRWFRFIIYFLTLIGLSCVFAKGTTVNDNISNNQLIKRYVWQDSLCDYNLQIIGQNLYIDSLGPISYGSTISIEYLIKYKQSFGSLNGSVQYMKLNYLDTSCMESCQYYTDSNCLTELYKGQNVLGVGFIYQEIFDGLDDISIFHILVIGKEILRNKVSFQYDYDKHEFLPKTSLNEFLEAYQVEHRDFLTIEYSKIIDMANQ